jgi:hypothetical protein
MYQRFQLLSLLSTLSRTLAATARLLIHPWTRRAVAAFLIGGALAYEMQTSALQASVLSRYAARLSYTVNPGPSPQIVFPQQSPFDTQRGYAQLLSSNLDQRFGRIHHRKRM